MTMRYAAQAAKWAKLADALGEQQIEASLQRLNARFMRPLGYTYNASTGIWQNRGNDSSIRGNPLECCDAAIRLLWLTFSRVSFSLTFEPDDDSAPACASLSWCPPQAEGKRRMVAVGQAKALPVAIAQAICLMQSNVLLWRMEKEPRKVKGVKDA